MGFVLTPLTASAFQAIINTAMRARCRRLGLSGFGDSESYYELIAGRLYQNVQITFELYKQVSRRFSGLCLTKLCQNKKKRSLVR